MRLQKLIAAVLFLVLLAAFMKSHSHFMKFSLKGLLRIAAALSFGCCFAGGAWLLCKALGSPHEDMFLLAAIGLIFIGLAFFVGALLCVAAERLPRKDANRERREPNPTA